MCFCVSVPMCVCVGVCVCVCVLSSSVVVVVFCFTCVTHKCLRRCLTGVSLEPLLVDSVLPLLLHVEPSTLAVSTTSLLATELKESSHQLRHWSADELSPPNCKKYVSIDAIDRKNVLLNNLSF
eukprot:GHVR01140871.1.p1 GENE.GHVR01140871.1~~GHVR01140871.1.p1  ORF type:complete len:124 (+),score=21.19 GHVR01140871.1:180-551(+)